MTLKNTQPLWSGWQSAHLLMVYGSKQLMGCMVVLFSVCFKHTFFYIYIYIFQTSLLIGVTLYKFEIMQSNNNLKAKEIFQILESGFFWDW